MLNRPRINMNGKTIVGLNRMFNPAQKIRRLDEPIHAYIKKWCLKTWKLRSRTERDQTKAVGQSSYLFKSNKRFLHHKQQELHWKHGGVFSVTNIKHLNLAPMTRTKSGSREVWWLWKTIWIHPQETMQLPDVQYRMQVYWKRKIYTIS